MHDKESTTLLEALTAGINLGNKSQCSDFSEKLEKYRQQVVDKFIANEDISLNDEIAAIVEAESLNPEQLKRVVEEVNNQIYMILYERPEHRRSRTRRVEFELANAAAIQQQLDGKTADSIEYGEEKTASVNEGERSLMEKVAELTLEEQEPITLQKKAKLDKTDLSYLKTVLADMQREASQLSESLDKIATDGEKAFYSLADAITKYHVLGYDCVETFSKIAQDSDMDSDTQVLLRDSIYATFDDCKKQYILPQSFSVEIPLVKVAAKQDFSLGNFSLAPQPHYPGIRTKTARVRAYSDLVKMAKEIKKYRDDAKSAQKKFDDFAKTASEKGIDVNDFEKTASKITAYAAQLDHQNKIEQMRDFILRTQ